VTEGRRDAHKAATRGALQAAADRLFATQGFAQTTVRQIADEAGVTERTFFRYFGSKNDLVIPHLTIWVRRLTTLIRDRPADEPPIQALERSLAGIRAGGPLARLYADGPPERQARTRAVSVALMLSAEKELIDAIRPRIDARSYHGDPELVAAVIGRCIVAAARSAAIHAWELKEQGDSKATVFPEQVDAAFRIVRMLEPGSPETVRHVH
jgi:AcrR family transcriptional regulator